MRPVGAARRTPRAASKKARRPIWFCCGLTRSKPYVTPAKSSRYSRAGNIIPGPISTPCCTARRISPPQRAGNNSIDMDVALQKRVFLVGPNASGKSNLLDVFRFLNDIVSVGGGFQEAAGPHRGGVTRLRSLSARRYPDIVIEVHIGSEDTPNAWEYELRFSQDNQRR